MADLTPSTADASAAVHALKALFRGREDDFVRRTTVNGKPRGGRAKRALRDSDYKAHLHGACSIGPYILSPDLDGGLGCRFGCVDIDRSDAAALAGAKSATALLQYLGLAPVPELSKRARWHVWVFFQETVRASAVRRVLGHAARTVLEEHQLYKLSEDRPSEFVMDRKTGERVSAVEVFPKHDALGDRVKWSNALQLPLNGARLREGRSAFVDPATWEPHPDQYAALLAIKQDSPEALAGAVALVPDPPKPERPGRRPRKRPPGSPDPWADVRAAIDLVGYVELCTGEEGRRSGPETAFLCPFHEEREPSLMVNADKGVFHCHGCGAAGDVFHFHERFHSVDKATALEQLADLAGVELGGIDEQHRQRHNLESGEKTGGRDDGRGPERTSRHRRRREGGGDGGSRPCARDSVDSGVNAGDAGGHGGPDRGAAEAVPAGQGDGLASREPTDALLLDYMLGPDGPRFTFREGSTAYSDRDGMSYNISLFRNLCGTRPMLALILARSTEVTGADLEKTEAGRYGVARRILRGWIGAIFGELLRRLPEGGTVGGVTATDAASLSDRMKLVLTKILAITTEAFEYTQYTSLLAYASGVAAGRWQKVGHHMAWCMAGPRIAMRPDFFMSHSGAKTARLGAKKIAQRLRKAHIIELDRVDRNTRVWVVRDDWIAETFDLEIAEKVDVPEPAAFDAKKAAAGDTEKEEVPF